MNSESVAFDIAHCSSFEPDYEPEHLVKSSPSAQSSDPFQNVSHRGWQTKRFTDYPQDLILQFKSGLCRISKIQILSHHYKIASQIEVYFGITKEQESDSMYIQFTRLGFVSLDNNNRFQDRELKSIKIQADCEYIRLVIRGCHENRLNVHKQVGFLALNIIGHEIVHELENKILDTPMLDDRYLIKEEDERSLASLSHNTNTDFNLEHWIQVIQHAEDECAQDEDFKEAKIYKELGDRLTGIWRFLINLENDKQQAVLIKNYDEAEKIKADIMQAIQNAELLLKQTGIQITRDGDILPYEDNTFYTTSEDENVDENENLFPDIQSIKPPTESKLQQANFHQTSAHPEQLLDEAIANWTSFDALSINNQYNHETASPSLFSARIPIIKEEAPIQHIEEKQEPQDPELIPEPLTADDLESCQVAITQFGQELVACVMSVKVKCRQQGLNALAVLIAQEQTTFDLEFIQACILMIQEAVTDSREPIFNQAIQTWKELYVKQILEINDSNKTIYGWIEKFFTRLLIRTSDNNPGIKITATKTVLDLLQAYLTLVPYCMKERMIRNMKDAKARIELITVVTRKILVPAWRSDPSVYRKDVMTFIVSYLKSHPHADVRKSTWDLLVLVTLEQGDIKHVSSFLENDTIKTLQQEMKKKKIIQTSTSTTVNELRALAVKSNTPKSTKKHAGKTDNKKNSNAGSTKKTTNTPKIIEEEEEEQTNVCIFCDKQDPEFNEDTLISHYYNECPVLTNCSMCQIILEVSTLKDHLKMDCERKHLLKQCNHCKESIPVEQWLQHTSKKECKATSQYQSRCPFCKQEMTKCTESDWKAHLTTKCPKNPRMIKKATKSK